MTDVRSGAWAELDGRSFAVRKRPGGVWSELEVAGSTVRLVGPGRRAEDLDLLVSVITTGAAAGHRFRLSSAPGDEVEVWDWSVPEEVVAELHLTGNPYDGWRGQVPFDRVEDVTEQVSVMHRRADGTR